MPKPRLPAAPMTITYDANDLRELMPRLSAADLPVDSVKFDGDWAIVTALPHVHETLAGNGCRAPKTAAG